MKWHIANENIPIIPICQIGLTNTFDTTYPAQFVNAAHQLLLQSHSKRSKESIEHLHIFKECLAKVFIRLYLLDLEDNIVTLKDLRPP
jgi:hypothetical protein